MVLLGEHAELSEEVCDDLLLGSGLRLVLLQNRFQLGGGLGVVPHGSQLRDDCQSDYPCCEAPRPGPIPAA